MSQFLDQKQEEKFQEAIVGIKNILGNIGSESDIWNLTRSQLMHTMILTKKFLSTILEDIENE